MRALVQRVAEATVRVDGEVIGEIGPGLLVLVCAMAGDGSSEAEYLARKIAKMRIFQDAAGKMNRSVLDQGGAVLVVSQFTLAADTRSGNRPGFSTAARPEAGEALYLEFVDLMRGHGITVATGSFGADMKVSLINDGPVTIWIDSDQA
ncbi:D-tyrosyl-tRNA(Tyr) deacylase [Epibacterium sp. SM1979]|uniref:D-aminoacyl-tRNA deacylase n=1 Tax=Tritonibacter litoralis TaxID=2662264 RepID=A0A843YEL6_9RHOB|nr:D-aminoacyl-tRNA deacylase [Tritonibacter litoralis]MQQ07733.1 D-tyrosyl-tRNA(Tyr) deacylase [Tritonibacter litoralis]